MKTHFCGKRMIAALVSLYLGAAALCPPALAAAGPEMPPAAVDAPMPEETAAGTETLLPEETSSPAETPSLPEVPETTQAPEEPPEWTETPPPVQAPETETPPETAGPPAPEEVPEPAGTPAPEETQEAGETPDSSEPPALAKTPVPNESPAPEESPVPAETPLPTATPLPEEAPAAEPEADTDVITAADEPMAIAAPYKVDTAGRNFANLVLFARFQDQQDDWFTDKAKVKKLVDAYDGAHGRAFTNYMRTISYGKLEVVNLMPQYDAGTGTIHAVCLPYSHTDAAKRNMDTAIIDAAIKELNIDPACLDLNGYDGIVDNVTVILQGGEGDNETSSVSLSAHKSNYPGTAAVAGKRIGTYNMLNTYHMFDTLLASEGALAAHEFLHSLGYPDLYRSGFNDYPVFTWDIMAGSSPYPSWPLAYLRMKCTGWVQLETVTESGTLTLNDPSVQSGHQAYILKSPLREQELFVIEMRRRNPADIQNRNTLDAKIGLPDEMQDNEAGLIVYRVDTTVEALSNYHGGTGIYVFRPGATETDQRRPVQKAWLGPRVGRTGIGSADMNATLADGALTFSDGTNSGIVIKNVRDVGDGVHMACEVEIPAEKQFDLWKDTGFASTAAPGSIRGAALAVYGNVPYLAAFQDAKLQMFSWGATGWTAVGQPVQESIAAGADMQMCLQGQALYLAYVGSDYKVHLRVFDLAARRWNESVSAGAGDCNGLAALSTGNTLYIAYVSPAGGRLLEYSGGALVDRGQYFSGSGGQPRLAWSGGSLYVSMRQADNRIFVLRYSGPGSFANVDGGTLTTPGGSYGLAALGGQLRMIACGKQQATVYTYSGGTNWSAGAARQLDSFSPLLAVTQGQLYMLCSPSNGADYTRVYRYDAAADTWIQEGNTVDTPFQQASLMAAGNYLYVGYVLQDSKVIRVKQKYLADPLQYIRITPPKNTTYTQWQTDIDLTGLTVVAYYLQGSRTLATGEYTVSGLSTETVGSRSATVNFGGKSAAFSYTVKAGSTPTPAPTPTPKPTPTPVVDYGPGVEGFVTRLYQVCLGRKPDAQGLQNWTNQLQNHQKTGAQVAYGFIFSPEFKGKNYCNQHYVTRLYNAFLGRGPDSQGLTNWLQKLKQGATREEIFNGFIGSSEFTRICASYGIDRGGKISVPKYGTVPKGNCSVCGMEDGVTSFVRRLYNVCLNRQPDPKGLKDWTNWLWDHKKSGSDVAYGFVFSDEFKGKNYSDEVFVEYMYKAFFGRNSDPAGKANWLDRMHNQGLSRRQVFDGFVGSQEFDGLCKRYGIVRK